MRVAVIGAGNVGKALGEVLRRKGHDVVYSVRDANDRTQTLRRRSKTQSRGLMPLSSPPHTTPPVLCSASTQRRLPEKL